jgi:glutaredoxin
MIVAVLLTSTAAAAREPDVELFTREGCPRCDDAKEVVRAMAEKRPELVVRVTDVQRDPEARRRLSELVRERNVGAASVPSVLVRGTLIVGWSKDSTPARIEALLAGASSTGNEERGESCSAEEATPCEPPPPPGELVLPVFGRVDVKALGLPTFTLAIGLVDGFNPCAMWVLLLLLALLVNLESRRKMALVAGVFVAVSGLAYYAFMAAWLNAFLLIGISRVVQVVLGLVAIAVGTIHIKDFFALHRGVSLSIPERAKPGIYARIRRIVTAEHLVAALAAASVLAVMVNTIELLCTAGLPALYTQVLAAQGLSPAARYAYLALYIAAYIADDVAMVVLAVVTLGRRKLQERGGRWLKLVSGGVILVVGLLLVVRPQWLAWR